MLKFRHTQKEDILRFAPWFAGQTTHIADYSLGFQFMWHKTLAPDFAFFGDVLILRELYAGKYYFYYPLSLSGSAQAEEAALAEIEKFCRDNDVRLHFTNVPRAKLPALVLRYGSSVAISNNRRWRDYLYEAEDFRSFAGKRHAGQRNHVNKFKKLYPDWSFRPYRREDLPRVIAFLKEYEGVQLEKEDRIADEELSEVYAILPHLEELGMVAGILEAQGRIVAFSAGERCGDMLVVHIEKALRGFEGAYPAIAQQFALAFADVRYLNRMDDAGDAGLRKSKLQYLPSELVDKYNVIPGRAIDGVQRLPTLETERLLLRPVGDEDTEAYSRLASDVKRNAYWGYDYREDMPKNADISWFLQSAREDFHHRAEMPLGIYIRETGKLIGEVVLHRFGYRAEAEVGVRLLPEAEGHGYAREAVAAYTEYGFYKLNLERAEAKCFRENDRSARMLLSSGMRETGGDDVYRYFYRTPEM